MALQRFNAVCFRGSFTADDDAVDAQDINPYIHDSSTSTSQESNPSYDVFSSIPNGRIKQNAADNIENGYISAGNECCDTNEVIRSLLTSMAEPYFQVSAITCTQGQHEHSAEDHHGLHEHGAEDHHGQHDHGVEYHHGQQEHSAKVHHEQYEHGAGANGSMAEEILPMRIILPPWSEVWVLKGCENSYIREGEGRKRERERVRERECEGERMTESEGEKERGERERVNFF